MLPDAVTCRLQFPADFGLTAETASRSLEIHVEHLPERALRANVLRMLYGPQLWREETPDLAVL